MPRTTFLKRALLLTSACALLAPFLFAADDPPGDNVNLCDLKPGETRTFADGKVTATRTGDSITVSLPEAQGEEDRTLSFDVSQGKCPTLVVKFGEGHNMLFLSQGDESGKKEVNVRMFQCDESEGEKCAQAMMFVGEDGGKHAVSAGHGIAWIQEGSAHVIATGPGQTGVGADGSEVRTFEEDSRVLRCPEGDTTMTLKEGEASGPFYCPRHNKPLEEARIKRVMKHVIKIQDE